MPPSDLQGPQGSLKQLTTADMHATEDGAQDSQPDNLAPAAATDNQVKKFNQEMAMGFVPEVCDLQDFFDILCDKDLSSTTVKFVLPCSAGFSAFQLYPQGSAPAAITCLTVSACEPSRPPSDCLLAIMAFAHCYAGT